MLFIAFPIVASCSKYVLSGSWSEESPHSKMDKVNQVLMLFGAELGVIPLDRKTILGDEES